MKWVLLNYRLSTDEEIKAQVGPVTWRSVVELGAHTNHTAVVQSFSRVRRFVTPRTAVHQASLSFTISWNLLQLMPIESIMPYNHLILSPPSPALRLPQHVDQGFPGGSVVKNPLANSGDSGDKGSLPESG